MLTAVGVGLGRGDAAARRRRAGHAGTPGDARRRPRRPAHRATIAAGPGTLLVAPRRTPTFRDAADPRPAGASRRGRPPRPAGADRGCPARASWSSRPRCAELLAPPDGPLLRAPARRCAGRRHDRRRRASPARTSWPSTSGDDRLTDARRRRPGCDRFGEPDAAREGLDPVLLLLVVGHLRGAAAAGRGLPRRRRALRRRAPGPPAGGAAAGRRRRRHGPRGSPPARPRLGALLGARRRRGRSSSPAASWSRSVDALRHQRVRLGHPAARRGCCWPSCSPCRRWPCW